VDARVLVSLSGITVRSLPHCAELATELDRREVPLSMLVTPNSADHDATAWMRDRARRGDDVLLHGYDHRVAPAHTVRLGRKAEFAALPAHEARLRLIAASSALERTGLRADGFAPPRWLVSRGTLDALRELGFPLCADLSTVRVLRTGELHRSRVQGFGGQRQGTETLRCFALVLSAARSARKGGLVRLGVDAADLARAGRRHAFLEAVDIALESGAHGSTYSALARRSIRPRLTAARTRPVAAP
jgi:predicted deacetylase